MATKVWLQLYIQDIDPHNGQVMGTRTREIPLRSLEELSPESVSAAARAILREAQNDHS